MEIKVSYFPLNHPIPKTNPQVKRTSVFQCALSKNQSKTSTILIWHIKRKLLKLFAFKCLLIKAQGAVASLINVNHFKVTRWICATWRNTANNGEKKKSKTKLQLSRFSCPQKNQQRAHLYQGWGGSSSSGEKGWLLHRSFPSSEEPRWLPGRAVLTPPQQR